MANLRADLLSNAAEIFRELVIDRHAPGIFRVEARCSSSWSDTQNQRVVMNSRTKHRWKKDVGIDPTHPPQGSAPRRRRNWQASQEPLRKVMLTNIHAMEKAEA